MDSYVVRIYRRGKGSRQNIVGLVELVDCAEEKSFTSFEELRAILNIRQGHPADNKSNGNGELNR